MQIDIIGVPIDLGADRRGVDMGPSAMRDAHLRQKLESDPAQPRHLLTETGVGYRFQP